MDEDFEPNAPEQEENNSSVDDSWRDIRPDFSGGDDAGGSSRIPGYSTAERNAFGQERGAAAEKAALSAAKKIPQARAAAEAAEKVAPIINKVGGNKITAAMRIKKMAPLILVLVVLGVMGVLVATAQWMAPFAYVANVIQDKSSLWTSMSEVSDKMYEYLFEGNIMALSGYNEVADTGGAAGGGSIYSPENFKLQPSFIRRMKKYRIHYFEEGRYMVFQELNYPRRVLGVTALEEGTGRIPGSVEVDGETLGITDRMGLERARNSSPEFNAAFGSSMRLVEGQIAGWFDSTSNRYHSRIVNSRGRFNDIKENASPDEVISAAEKTGLPTGSNGGVGEATTSEDGKAWKFCPLYDDHGHVIGEDETKACPDEWDESEGLLRSGMSEQEIEDALVNYARKNILSAGESGGATGAEPQNILATIVAKIKALFTGKNKNDLLEKEREEGTFGCMVYKSIGAISQMIGALHSTNSINYSTQFLESVDQIKAGNSKSALHYNMNQLSQKGTAYGMDGGKEVVPVSENKASMESQAWNSVFGASPVTSEDPIVKLYNTDYLSSNYFTEQLDSGAIGGIFEKTLMAAEYTPSSTESQTAFRACTNIQMSNGEESMIDKIEEGNEEGIGVTATGGSSFKLLSSIKRWIAGILKKSLMDEVEMVVRAIIKTMTPHIKEWLDTNLINDIKGESGAYALDMGIDLYFGRQLQSGAGLAANGEQLMAMYRANQRVIAKEAKYERDSKSPFDVTSKNTFLGSIVHAMIPFATTLSLSPAKSMNTLIGTTGQSALALLPTVKAASEEAEFKGSLNADCLTLADHEIVATAYCNHYSAIDIAQAVELTPLEVCLLLEEQEQVEGCFSEGEGEERDPEEDGVASAYNPKIVEGSDFEKYIVACGLRESQLGYFDQGVQSFAYEPTTAKGLLKDGTGNIGIIPDAVKVKSLNINYENTKYSTGAICQSEESVLYSTFLTHQRWMENAGIIDTTTETAFVDRYYEAHPLDNSYEGVLARYSGLDIDDVEYVLALFDYAEALAQYDPSDRLPMPVMEAEELPHYESNTMVAAEFVSVMAREVVYSDLRMRTLVA